MLNFKPKPLNVSSAAFFCAAIFFLFPSLIFAKYTLSVCTNFRNDAKYIAEWIDFHLMQGVEHFYLYDNLSTDNPEKVLEPYIRQGFVEIIKWPFPARNATEYAVMQLGAYRDAIKRCDSTWVAFIDTDEFLFSPLRIDLKRAIENYNGFSGIAVNWIVYGTSNVERTDGKILGKLLYRSELTDGMNFHVKSIVKIEDAIDAETAHNFLYKPGCQAVTENFAPKIPRSAKRSL